VAQLSTLGDFAFMAYKSFPIMDHEGQARWRHVEELKKLDRRELIKMDDVALAKWQSGFASDEAQYRLAEHEWQRRLTAEQISATMRAARGQAWFGIAAAIIGVLLTLAVQSLTR
jgi:hypothetical protein